MDVSEARLEVLRENGHLCTICAKEAHWSLEGGGRTIPLCDGCAATILFSSLEATSSLLQGKTQRERDTILYKLWVCRSVASA
jgi:hypothetical protein